MDDFFSQFENLRKSGLGVPILLLTLLAMVILPLPPFALDLLFTINISIAILVLLSGIYSLRPLDFASFPTIILVSTLLRLALNVASTRVVLLYGHSGGDAAGEVIRAFGEVVIGGNFVVGIVVFAILVIINFVVVTKGAGRISEVSARFTLDAMPGKQMAIDADLNAGVISQEEARTRRQEVSQEADFYGAMDGASKFVRGDAIAGILILFINIIGGILIGTLQHGLSALDALKIYTILTVGDGLVAQIPSLVLSTAAAIMVTRVSRSENMSEQIYKQIMNNSKPMTVAGSILFGLGIIPGMPNIVFLLMAMILFYLAYYIDKTKEEPVQASNNTSALPANSKDQPTAQTQQQPKAEDISWEDVKQVDDIAIEIGYKLIGLVEEGKGELLNRVKSVRKKISQELGFLFPSIHIKDNLELPGNNYRINISGVTMAEDTIYPELMFAINPGEVLSDIHGTPAVDPSFGLEAKWIESQEKDHAQSSGYTVVDSSTVIATHLSQILYKNADHLLGHDQVQTILENLSKIAPKLVEVLVPEVISLSNLVHVLQNLLKEGIPINDIKSIAESITENANEKDPTLLTEHVRSNIGALIVQQIVGYSSELPVVTIDEELETIINKSIDPRLGTLLLEPGLADKLTNSLKDSAKNIEDQGGSLVLLVNNNIRRFIAKFALELVDNVNVISFAEVPKNINLKLLATIGN